MPCFLLLLAAPTLAPCRKYGKMWSLPPNFFLPGFLPPSARSKTGFLLVAKVVVSGLYSPGIRGVSHSTSPGDVFSFFLGQPSLLRGGGSCIMYSHLPPSFVLFRNRAFWQGVFFFFGAQSPRLSAVFHSSNNCSDFPPPPPRSFFPCRSSLFFFLAPSPLDSILTAGPSRGSTPKRSGLSFRRGLKVPLCCFLSCFFPTAACVSTFATFFLPFFLSFKQEGLWGSVTFIRIFLFFSFPSCYPVLLLHVVPYVCGNQDSCVFWCLVFCRYLFIPHEPFRGSRQSFNPLPLNLVSPPH